MGAATDAGRAGAGTVRFAIPAAPASPPSPPQASASASASGSASGSASMAAAAAPISPSKRLLGFAARQQLRSMPTSPRGLVRGGSAPSVLPAAQLALSDQHTFFGVDLAALDLSEGDPLDLREGDSIKLPGDSIELPGDSGELPDARLQELVTALEVAESSFAEPEAAALRN